MELWSFHFPFPETRMIDYVDVLRSYYLTRPAINFKKLYYIGVIFYLKVLICNAILEVLLISRRKNEIID